jgi:DNA-binding Lrp family transcriptional regulator
MFTERDWQRFLLGDPETLEERLRKYGHLGKHADALLMVCHGYSTDETDSLLDLRGGTSLGVMRRAKAEVREALCQRAVLAALTNKPQGLRQLAKDLEQHEHALRNRLHALQARHLVSKSAAGWKLGVLPQVLEAFQTRTELLTCTEIEERVAVTISPVRRGVRQLVEDGWLLWSGARSGINGAPYQYRRMR